ncbi:hypothetical protein AK830_g6702 [Neonectria ditissima]|uniref:Uncharacterized protein n=1 Tax=Neonectria ditissima TaxID=78410 RepID=A0A0P7BI24_9HYPO|nr:hypothetical protein AK830_g6702 [Neonectria ditissima]
MADAGGSQGGTSGSGGQTSGGRDSGQSDAVIEEAQVAFGAKAGEMSQVIKSGDSAKKRRQKASEKK